nr:hypothetical protein [Tanacetum cinerariifolium]
MSTSTYLIIILSGSDVKDAFSFTNTPHYTPTSLDYSTASSGNTAFDSKTESDPSEDPFEDHLAPLAISPFHDDLYIKAMQTYNATSNESPIPPPQAPIAPPTVCHPSLVISTLEMIIENIQIRHRSDMKSHLDMIHELKNHKMASKRTSTAAAPAMTQAAIRKLVADSVVLLQLWKHKLLQWQILTIPIGTPKKVELL